MLLSLRNRINTLFQPLTQRMQTGPLPYIITVGALLLTTIWVYFSPRSTLAFLLFLTSATLIYILPMKRVWKIVIALVVALVIVPIIGLRNIFYLEVIFQISVFAALALGLNIVVGFTGLLNLGYVAFYAVGAYLWAFFGSQQPYLLHSIPGTVPPGTPFFLPQDAFFLFLVLGAIVTAVVGILLGLPVLRVRGDYLAIVTLGFGEVIRVLFNNLDKPVNLTNGPQGISPVLRPSIPQFMLDAWNALFAGLVGRPVSSGEFYNVVFYLLTLIVCVIVIITVIRLDDSKTGRAWMAIREDELAAASMGIPVVRYKLLAFSVAASFAGVMGVLFAASRTFVSPESFNFMQSIGVLSMVILGGLGSIPGVILGAAIVTILNLQILQGLSLWLSSVRQSDAVIPIINFAMRDLSSQLDPAKYQRMLFGIILVVMMIYRQEGIIPAQRRKRVKQLEKSLDEKTTANTDTEPVIGKEAGHGAV